MFSLCARVNLAETSGGRIDISAAKRGECQMARKLGAKKGERDTAKETERNEDAG